MDRNSLGYRIRLRRGLKRITQKELANMVGLSYRSVISSIEIGVCFPQIETLMKIQKL